MFLHSYMGVGVIGGYVEIVWFLLEKFGRSISDVGFLENEFV